MTRSCSSIRTIPLALAALAVALLLAAPAAHAGKLPSGYPAEVSLPPGVLKVFLVGEEYEESGGKTRLVARSYRLNQEISDADAVRGHFCDLFDRLGWRGGFDSTRASTSTSGAWAHGDVSVRIDLREGERDHFALRVRVGVD